MAAAESENAPSIDDSMENDELLTAAVEAESQETSLTEEETRDENLD